MGGDGLGVDRAQLDLALQVADDRGAHVDLVELVDVGDAARREDVDLQDLVAHQIDAHDLGAEIYVPLEFEGRVTIGDFRVASSQALLDVLEEMREELSVDADEKEDEEEEDDAEDEDEGTVIEAQLRHIWHLVADGATESIEKNLPLHLQL